jgi:4-hydroxy-tetrahydrodipicolinate reductase
MTQPTRIVHIGLGPIGASLARLAAERPGLKIVGAVDVDAEKIGRDLSEVVGLSEPTGVSVGADFAATLAETRPELVVHATSSSLARVMSQLETAIRAGVGVVSTCEELAFPFQSNGELAEQLDRLAKEHGVAVLGTGINPGFAMDTFPLAMTAVCQGVEHVTVRRVQEAGNRRLPLQLKVGAGMTVDEFRKQAEAGTVRHVGLAESAQMIADTLGWALDGIDQTIEPVIATQTVRSQYLEVPPGRVTGVHQVLTARSGGREVIRLDLRMHIGTDNPRDEVEIRGVQPVHVIAQGGLLGDPATAAIVINAIPRVLDARPGLLTMRDVPLVHSVGLSA